MTTSALTGGFAVCQTRLGREGPRPQGPGLRPRADVPPGRRHDPAARRRAPRPLARDPRLARRPGLRLRADHRPAAARGEHDPPAVRVPRGLADPRRHVARDARPGERRDGPRRSRRRRAGWPTTRRASSGSAARTAPSPPPTTLEMAEALAAFHFPDDLWARVIYDLVLAARARPDVDDRDARRRARADLLRPRRQLRHREPRTSPPTQAEERVERQAREFELLKPYLVERWRALDDAGRRGARVSAGRRCRPGS